MTLMHGNWRLSIRSKDHPTFVLDDREVASGSTWDAGTLQLSAGSRLVLRVTGSGADKLEFLVYDARDRFVTGVGSLVGPPRSDLLAPGDYVLVARGDGVAAPAQPFSIAAGKDTELEVQAQAGVRQRFEFESASGNELSRAGYRLLRDGRIAFCNFASVNESGALVDEVSLLPGSYTLTVRDTEPGLDLHGTCAFVVGNEPGQVVRVALR